jgi:soluble lytic murein transglycosylase
MTRIFVLVLVSVLFTVSCSAQTEEQALAQLRQMTADGKLPPENVVADIESRFVGRRTGALAKLLHARIRFENNDFAGAAAILNSDVFRTKTKLGDYALWLRGKALQGAGDHGEAMNVFSQLWQEYPDSIRVRDTKLLWSQSALVAGRAAEVAPILNELSQKYDPDAFLLTAKAYEAKGDLEQATNYYRRTYLLGTGTSAAKEAAAKLNPTDPTLVLSLTKEQAIYWADRLLAGKRFQEAADAYVTVGLNFHGSDVTPHIQTSGITALAGAGKMSEAESLFRSSGLDASNREEGYRQLVLGYAKAKLWLQAKTTADEMRSKFPAGSLTAKTFIDAGLAARDQKNSEMEGYFLNTAVAAFPNAVEVAQAQFEAAWFQHESGNFALSSQGFIDHLARYTDKDTTNRGKAGYWAARDSQRAGKLAEACALYNGVLYRYGANWYGYLALDRLSAMKAAGQCSSTAPPNATIAKAVANLRTVTVAAETAGQKEHERIDKSDELSVVGLFDWAIDELNEAKKTASNSPSINLALARHYRWKGDNTSALVAMQKSYPDYAQMFPEEMDREAWSFFYPLTNWADIQKWSAARGLDKYQVAGFIRQETVFTVRAKSPANAYGLMQLLLPTAKTVARKYGSTMPTSADDLYNPSLNIELGTAFLKDMYEKFGRVEYVSVAYNAGPNRVPQWRATLPAEIDEFAEAIPFKETKQYVQGIIRNSAQYRRLYDDNGNFKANVGTRPLRGEIDSKPREQFTAENPDVAIDDSGDE